jgi:hypothetical protein
MIETDQQRRWWFATHPEFSSSRRGIRDHAQKTESRTQTTDPNPPLNWFAMTEEQRRAYNREMGKIHGLISDPHTFLDIAPYKRFITAPIASIKGLLQSQARGYVLHIKAPDVPGEWIEVPRPLQGLRHQAEMSGQKIIERAGKYFVKEWARYGTFFDDFKNGILYEYKGSYSSLIRKDGLFYDLAPLKEEIIKQADAQLRSARGLPVVWRVGDNQVKAFSQVLKDRPDIKINP